MKGAPMILTHSLVEQLHTANELRLEFTVPERAASVPAVCTIRRMYLNRDTCTPFPTTMQLVRHGDDGKVFRPFAGNLVVPVITVVPTHENSILRSLQVGDAIAFELGLNRGSYLTDDRGLVVDILSLRVTRQNPEGAEDEFRFTLLTTITTPDSPVRGITLL